MRAGGHQLSGCARVATAAGAERAEGFGHRNGVPGELLVRLHPERVIAQTDIAGY
jgi:hypothetical protein